LDYDIKLFCATASECINPGLAKEKYSAFEDTLSVDFVHPEEIVNSDFSRKYFEKYSENSGVVVTYAGLGYDAVMILKDTFSKCDPEDKPCVLSALGTYKNLNDDSVIGTIGFEDRILKLDYNIYGYSNKWDELA
jgi:ABC-type branched-subunit amino acid transport system substrate-binding protein